MPSNSLILWLSHINKHDEERVGTKAAQFGELAHLGFSIPEGFILTSSAYTQFLEQNNLKEKITALLSITSFDHPDALEQTAHHIKRLIIEAPLPGSLLETISQHYDKLSSIFGHAKIILRPSVTREKNTTLPAIADIQGETNLIIQIKEFWSSTFDANALFYRHKHKRNQFDFTLAILIQKMVPTEKSGLTLTIDPATNDRSKIIIETTNSQYEINKTDISFTKTPKETITHNQILDLALLGKKIEQHYYFPQEIEWAIHKNTIYLLNIKAIHTPIHAPDSGKPSTHLQLLLKGTPGSHGIASGPLKVILKPHDINTLSHGDILALSQANALYLPAIKKAAAIIVDESGRTSYAATIARELGIPAVVGTKTGTKLDKNMVVTVNGSTGEIYKGGHGHAYHEPRTATKIYTDTSAPFIYLQNLSKTELTMIKHAQKQKNNQNLWLVLPPALTTRERLQMKHTLSFAGIHRSTSVKIFIKINTPAQALTLEEFIKEGIDGIMIDIHSLTGHMLGLSHIHESDHINSAVLLAVEKTIKTASQHHIHSSVQFNTKHIPPLLLEKLVEWGISSVIVEPAIVESIRQEIIKAERKLIEKS